MPRGPQQTSISQVAERLRGAAARGDRVLVGIAGAPGSGKSTLAGALVAALHPDAVHVPMDGFHLSNEVLVELGARDRKGAPDTFDAAGYIHLLRRLRERVDEVVYAPSFRRDLEEPVASGIAVPRDVPIVVTEGNYLLLDQAPWPQARALLDEVWFLAVDDDLRHARLVARHVAFGKAPDDARAWVASSDERNAALVTATAHADLVICLEGTAARPHPR